MYEFIYKNSLTGHFLVHPKSYIFLWIHVWIHDYSWIHIWIQIWILCQDTSWYTRIHSFSWIHARYHEFGPLVIGEIKFVVIKLRRTSPWKSCLNNIVKNIVKNIVNSWKIFIYSLLNSWGGAPTRHIWRGQGSQAILPLLRQSNLPHCQPVYLAKLQCQICRYLPLWSCHALSSCYQRA